MAGGRLTARLLLRVAGSAGEVAAAVGTRCRAQSASSSILTRSFAAGVAPLARCPGGDSETWTANRRLLRGDPARIDRLRWFGSVAPVELDDLIGDPTREETCCRGGHLYREGSIIYIELAERCGERERVTFNVGHSPPPLVVPHAELMRLSESHEPSYFLVT